jgi:hypothetical protein
MAIPSVIYDLGARFEGLAVSYRAYRCIPAPRGPGNTVSGPLVAHAFVLTIYGDCDASEGSCAPALEIQDDAECAQNPNSYKPSPGFTGEPGEGTFGRKERTGLSAAPWIPVLRLEADRRIELFAGRTTVVVGSPAGDAGLARRAANALARAIAKDHPRSTAARLRADANQPGDGSACRTFRGRV